MEIKTFNTHQSLSEAIAELILNLIKIKPNATLVLTSGDTPILAYQILAQRAKKSDFDKVQIIGLDEWVGIPPSNEGSCRYIVEKHLLAPLGLSENNFTFFDGMSKNLNTECQRIDKLIFDRGGLDLILVGLGLNGHLGLNEPGTSFEAYCQITNLAEMTIKIGQKYFNAETKLSQGVTVGLKHLQEAKMAVIMANGIKKAEIISKTVNATISNEIPSTIFQLHKNGFLYLDQDAASLL